MRKFMLITALVLSTSATAHAGLLGLSAEQTNAVEAPSTYQVQSSQTAPAAAQEQAAAQPAPPQTAAQPSAADMRAAKQQAMRQKQMMMAQQRKMKQARMQQMKQRQMANMSLGQAVGYKVQQVETRVKMTLVHALLQ